MDARSPQVRSISSSLLDGALESNAACASNSSVVLPIAETTTQTRCPSDTVDAIRLATVLSLPTFETELPPYFWTTIDIASWANSPQNTA